MVAEAQRLGSGASAAQADMSSGDPVSAWAGRLRAANRLHSLPSYHGAYAALWAAIGSLKAHRVTAPWSEGHESQ